MRRFTQRTILLACLHTLAVVAANPHRDYGKFTIATVFPMSGPSIEYGKEAKKNSTKFSWDKIILEYKKILN